MHVKVTLAELLFNTLLVSKELKRQLKVVFSKNLAQIGNNNAGR